MSPHKPALRSSQVGFSIVEMMVGLVIGLVLVGGITAVYLSSLTTSRNRSDTGRLQETGRDFLQQFAQQIRQAESITVTPYAQGAKYDTEDLIEPTAVDSAGNGTAFQHRTALTDGLSNISANGVLQNVLSSSTSASIAALQSANKTASPTTSPYFDSISIAYLAAPPNQTAPAQRSNSNIHPAFGADCLGQTTRARLAGTTMAAGQSEIHSGVTYLAQNGNQYFDFPTIISSYYVARDATTNSNTLYCLGSGNTSPQPIISNVEEFRLQYKVSRFDEATQTTLYRWYNAKTLNDKSKAGSTFDTWRQVQAVSVCLILIGENNSAATGASDANAGKQSYTNCDDTTTVAADTKKRMIFRQIFALRNALAGTM